MCDGGSKVALTSILNRRHLLSVSVLGGAALTLGASWEPTGRLEFAPPFDSVKIEKTTRAVSPDNSVTPVVSLDNRSRYESDDQSRSTVDPDLALDYEQSVAPLRQFSESVVKLANRFAASGGTNLGAAAEAAGHLRLWAQASALADFNSTPAQLNRSTTLAAASLAYLQIRPAFESDDEDMAQIAVWLSKTAGAVMRHYAYASIDRDSTRNNHRYWAGLAATCCGLAARERNIFESGMDTCWSGIGQVTKDGALPLELGRGKRALYYHAYATGPLILLAEIGARNGRPMYSAGDDALHRLVAFTLAGLDDPERIAELAGEPQEALGQGGNAFERHQIAWLEIYNRRFPERNPWRRRMAQLRPMGSTPLGGNLTMLSRVGSRLSIADDLRSNLRGPQT